MQNASAELNEFGCQIFFAKYNSGQLVNCKGLGRVIMADERDSFLLWKNSGKVELNWLASVTSTAHRRW